MSMRGERDLNDGSYLLARRLGGSVSVDQAAGRLRWMYDLGLDWLRTLAGRLIEVAGFEEKVELAHHLFLLAEISSALRLRLEELRVSRKSLDEESQGTSALLCDEFANAVGIGELLQSHSEVLTCIAESAREYLQVTDRLLDRPSVTLLRRFLPDIDDAIAWTTRALGKQTAPEIERASAYGKVLALCIAALGGQTGQQVVGDLPASRRGGKGRPARQIECARDPRLPTFSNTRDYRGDAQREAAFQNDFERRRFEMYRVQRDELDAIETFANVLHDLPSPPFELVALLARLIEDEARHAEAGQQAIECLGFDPFDVPCSTIGIKVRSSMDPIKAFAQISLFGELSIVGPMRELSEEAIEKSDQETGRFFDFVHADELMHLRKGRAWLRSLVPDGDLEALIEETRVTACRRLAEEGVVGEDYALSLTPRQIGRLIGE
jgi:hypothetical protein